MSFKVVISFEPDKSDPATDQLAEKIRLDPISILELTLAHWEELCGGNDDYIRTALEAALEDYLHRRWPRHLKYGFAEAAEVKQLLISSMRCFFRDLEPVLTKILECFMLSYWSAELRLIGWVDDVDPIIEVHPRTQ